MMLALLLLGSASAPAQELPADASHAFAPFLMTGSAFDESGRRVGQIHGLTRSFAPRWKASYGLARAEETELGSALLRYDQTLAYGTRSDRSSRDSWRHFLGIEYDAAKGLALHGGVAKSGGITDNRGASLSPTGYEKLRLNTGARWRGESWGLDGTFSFIPFGASRFPNDSGYFPGAGDNGTTYLFSLTVSRRF